MADDKKNVYGIKYEVDIEELKTSTAEAGRQIKLANAKFNEASSAMENWATDVDGLNAKLTQLNTILEAEKAKLAQSKKSYNDLLDSIEDNAQQIEILKNTKKDLIEQYGIESREVNDVSKELAKLEREQAKNVKQADTLNISIKNQQASVNRTQKSINYYGNELKDVEEAQKKAEMSGRSLEEELKDIKKSSDEAGEATKEASEGFTIMKGAIASVAGNVMTGFLDKTAEAVTSLFSLSEATEEYRQMTAKVQGSANSFGYSIEFAKENYKEFYSYLKDDQMATNAITNLMGMKITTESLNNVAEASIATWSAYGDSIPIESLTESITESAQVAKVTGVLADTINWAKRSNEDWSMALSGNSKAQKAFNKAIKEGQAVEDAYSMALQACTSTQERADLIASTLNQTFGKSKETYDQLTGSIRDANRQEIELKETQAELGKTVEPMNTSFTKFKNEVLKSMTPYIKDVSREFQKWIDEVDTEAFAKSLGNMFGVAMDGLKWITKNGKPVTAVIVGMTTAWLANKNAQTLSNGAMLITKGTTALLTGVTKGATLATNAHTIATNAGTVAQKAFNLAQSASPIGLVTTLIIGGTVALGTYIASMANAKSEHEKNMEAIEKEANARKELINTQNKAIETANTEMNNVRELSNELRTLTNENGKVKAGYEARANYIVNELNTALGTEMKMHDGVISKYKETMASIDNMIAKKRAEAILEAQLPAYKEAVTKATEAQIKASKLEAQISETKKKNDAQIAKLQKELADAKGYEAQSILYKIAILQQETAQQQQEYDKQKKIIEGYYGDIALYETNATRLASENAQEWQKIETSTVTAKSTSTWEKIRLLEQQKIAEEEHLRYLEEKYKGSNDKIELQQIESQQRKIQNINNEITAMTSTVEGRTPEYVDKYKQMAFKALKEFDGDTQKYFGVSQKKFDNVIAGLKSKDPEVQAEARKTAEEMLKKLQTNPKSKKDPYYQAGINTLDGYLNGTNAKAPSLWESMKSYGTRILGEFNKALGIHSPSRKARWSTQMVMKGLGLGFEDEEDVLLKKVRNVATNLLDVLKENMEGTVQLNADVKANLMNAKNSLQTRNAVPQIAGNDTSRTQNVIFNQTINSPKSLSRLELYQKTNSLLFSAKGGLKNV